MLFLQSLDKLNLSYIRQASSHMPILLNISELSFFLLWLLLILKFLPLRNLKITYNLSVHIVSLYLFHITISIALGVVDKNFQNELRGGAIATIKEGHKTHKTWLCPSVSLCLIQYLSAEWWGRRGDSPGPPGPVCTAGSSLCRSPECSWAGSFQPLAGGATSQGCGRQLGLTSIKIKRKREREIESESERERLGEE